MLCMCHVSCNKYSLWLHGSLRNRSLIQAVRSLLCKSCSLQWITVLWLEDLSHWLKCNPDTKLQRKALPNIGPSCRRPQSTSTAEPELLSHTHCFTESPQFYYSHCLVRYDTPSFLWYVLCHCKELININLLDYFFISGQCSTGSGFSVRCPWKSMAASGWDEYTISEWMNSRLSSKWKGDWEMTERWKAGPNWRSGDCAFQFILLSLTSHPMWVTAFFHDGPHYTILPQYRPRSNRANWPWTET